MTARTDHLGFLRHLHALDVPIFTASPGNNGSEFRRPDGWQRLDPGGNPERIKSHRPGHALAAVMGGPVAVLDVDTKNGADVERTRELLAAIGATLYADVLTPSGGRHFYVAGHPDLPTVHATEGRDGLTGHPGVEIISYGANVFLPGTCRPTYDGAGYDVLLDNLEALADGGDADGAEALAGWVADHRAHNAEPFESAAPWDGTPPDARQVAYLRAVLDNQCAQLAAMGPRSGRNTAHYTAALKCGSFVAGAGMDESEVVARLTASADVCGLTGEDGERSVSATIRSGLRNGRRNPRAVPPEKALTVVGASPVDPGTGELIDEAQTDQRLEERLAFNRAVSDEAHKLRVRDAATQLVRQERLGDQPPPDGGTLAELLARPIDTRWRIEGILPARGRMLWSAKRKAGKTTATGNLARSLLTGEPFVGHFEVEKLDGRVFALNYEVTGEQYAAWMDDIGVPRDRLYVLNLRGRRNLLATEDGRLELVEIIRAQEGQVLIVDPFGRAYTGKSQNDPAEVTPWLVRLDEVAEQADISEVILTTHTGWEGERTRGSTALEDWPDSIVTMTWDEETGDRFVKALGRDVDLAEDRLDYDPATRRLTLSGAGNRKQVRATERIETLAQAVREIVDVSPGINTTRLSEALRDRGLHLQREDTTAAVRVAVDQGWIRRESGPGNSKQHFPGQSSRVVPESSPGQVVSSPDPSHRDGTTHTTTQPSSSPDPEPDVLGSCATCFAPTPRYGPSGDPLCRRCRQANPEQPARNAS